MAKIEVDQIIANSLQNVAILKVTSDSGKVIYVPVKGFLSQYSAIDDARRTVRGY